MPRSDGDQSRCAGHSAPQLDPAFDPTNGIKTPKERNLADDEYDQSRARGVSISAKPYVVSKVVSVRVRLSCIG